MIPERYGTVFHLENLVDGYVDVIDAIMVHGVEAAPRGVITRELLGVTLVVPANAPMLPVGTGRKVSSKLAAVEALQVIGGYSDPGALFAVNEHLRDFADQGAFHGAYGPRIRGQMETAVRRMREDPETRRAVVTLWDPSRDQIEGVKNYPCVSELQFLCRWTQGILALDLHVTMRANDAWHGLAYDGFVFNQLQHTVARMLDVPVGVYVHHAASMHVYREHWSLVGDLNYAADLHGFAPTGVRSLERARQIGDGALVYSANPSEAWYIDRAGKKEATA